MSACIYTSAVASSVHHGFLAMVQIGDDADRMNQMTGDEVRITQMKTDCANFEIGSVLVNELTFSG